MAMRGSSVGGGSPVVSRSDDSEPDGSGGAGRQWPNNGVLTWTEAVMRGEKKGF